MPSERYYIDAPLFPQTTQELKGAEFHHLIHVMRTRKGDRVELVNGKGVLAQGIVQDFSKDKARIQIEEIHQESPSSSHLILAQAFSKQNRLDFILEKGTELAVDHFWLFPGQHSAKKECYPSQMERMHALTIAAMKQCGRLYLPTISFIPPIAEWQDQLTHSSSFFGDLDPQAPLFKTALETHPPVFPSIFITGPEGGFSEEEVKLLKNQGAIGVKLHKNILRTETAALIAVGLLTHLKHQEWHLG